MIGALSMKYGDVVLKTKFESGVIFLLHIVRISIAVQKSCLALRFSVRYHPIPARFQ